MWCHRWIVCIVSSPVNRRGLKIDFQMNRENCTLLETCWTRRDVAWETLIHIQTSHRLWLVVVLANCVVLPGRWPAVWVLNGNFRCESRAGQATWPFFCTWQLVGGDRPFCCCEFHQSLTRFWAAQSSGNCHILCVIVLWSCRTHQISTCRPVCPCLLVLPAGHTGQVWAGCFVVIQCHKFDNFHCITRNNRATGDA